MSLLDKAKAAAETAATKAKEGVEDVQAKRERSQLLSQLGSDTLALIDKGEVSHPTLEATAAKIRALDAADGPAATEAAASD
jgi:hypothetical protein